MKCSSLWWLGTTGKPKCIVHRAGGVLLQHKKVVIITSCAAADLHDETPYSCILHDISVVKELMLHCDMNKGDRMQVIYNRPIHRPKNKYIFSLHC